MKSKPSPLHPEPLLPTGDGCCPDHLIHPRTYGHKTPVRVAQEHGIARDLKALRRRRLGFAKNGLPRERAKSTTSRVCFARAAFGSKNSEWLGVLVTHTHVALTFQFLQSCVITNYLSWRNRINYVANGKILVQRFSK